MNTERLLMHYEQIADAPDAIARLRRFILDLAVRGKLMPQDSNDEPASELLKRIAREKDRLVKVGAVRKQPSLQPINDVEMLCALPTHWVWVRVGEIFDYDAGTKRDPKDLDQSRWLLELEDIEKDTSKITDRLRVSDRDSLSTKSEFAVGDILYGKLRPYLNKVVVADEPGYSTTEIVAIRPFLKLCPEYCALAFRRPDFVAYVEQLGRGTKMPRLRTPDAIVGPFPLPPLAEQQRIVAKVNELMALCDQLEAAQRTREAVRDRLTAASLARLSAPDPETFQADIKFALDALPAIITRPNQIKHLRQTILNLAVRGRLVPQDANEEPAAELLKRIQTWQRHEIAQRKIRAPRKPLGPIKNDENPYPQPIGWAFARLGEIIYIQSGDGLTAANMKGVRFPVFGGNGINGYHDKSNVVQPTIVIGRVGYYCGSIHVTSSAAWITDNAFITHFSHDDICLRFLVLLLNGTNLKEDENATAQPVISGSKIYPIVVGLPPLAEQHRIVAKVDELMALCDRLEANLTAAAATRRRLLGALLAEALAPTEDREMEAAE